MKVTAIIVAAGKGKRLAAKTPKQYIKIAGRPLLAYTLETFNNHPLIDKIVLVVAKDKIKNARRLLSRYCFDKVEKVVAGRSSRGHSVWQGVKTVDADTDFVAIHDGVRPLADSGLISRVIRAAWRYGASIPALTPKATIKQVSNKGWIEKTLVRSQLAEVQTPQVFKYQLIEKCCRKYKRQLAKITDESTLLERAGYRIKVVAGDYHNIKVTTKDDLDIVNSRSIPVRTGMGYDIHPLQKGRRLILGGVTIPSARGLFGHSDADVLLHAITDALLGAAGKRDIGWHFPDTDKRYKNVDSSILLRAALRLVAGEGWQVVNCDSIIVAQSPRLKPYNPEMTRNIAKWLQVSKAKVNVKYCSPEEIGPLGDQKAIAALAVISIKGKK